MSAITLTEAPASAAPPAPPRPDVDAVQPTGLDAGLGAHCGLGALCGAGSEGGSATSSRAPHRDHGPDRLTRAIAADLAATGKWSQWSVVDDRLAWLTSLEDALEAWERRDVRCYEVVAALAAIGSRRGRNDDDAALAVVALMAPGIAWLAAQLRDVCVLDDVRATMWEEVKRAEPQLGALATSFLLRRTRQRLTRPGAPGMLAPVEELSLEAVLDKDESCDRGFASRGMDRDMVVAAVEAEDPVRDLVDLLSWATTTGVIQASELELIVELLAAAQHGVPTEEAQALAGARRGVGMRTIRRRHSASVERLRRAARDYLAETA